MVTLLGESQADHKNKKASDFQGLFLLPYGFLRLSLKKEDQGGSVVIRGSRNLVGISIYLCHSKQKKLSVCHSM